MRLITTRHFPPLLRQLSTKPSVAKSIYISKSTDIFTNLALEDWLYRHFDFTNHHLLMLWQNKPCVVIGRHQNPWLECNFAALPYLGVKLARRNSGGGTVYHDLGNLNLTFFTARGEYSRILNLELIVAALRKRFGVDVEISAREDLCVGGCKVSGTASKLGRTSAYHHCTLLVDVERESLSQALKNDMAGVKTNATKSVKSEIANLSENKPGLTVRQVLDSVAMEFSPATDLKLVSPEEAHFPGLTKIREEFFSQKWRYEKTPKFKISRSICTDGHLERLDAVLTVEQGKVSETVLKCGDKSDFGGLEDLFAELKGRLFSREVMEEFEVVVNGLRNSESCRTILLNL